MTKHSSSVPEPRADSPHELSSLAPSIGFVHVLGRWAAEVFSFYSDYCNWWRRSLGVADGLLAAPPHLLREWSVPIGRGQIVGEQMATLSFQCLPRWLPPHIYAMLRIWGNGGFQALGAQVFTVLPSKGA